MKWLIAIAALCAATAVQAANDVWRFTFHHLRHYTAQWNEDKNDWDVTELGFVDVSGRFQSEDLNHNGTVEANELRELYFDQFGWELLSTSTLTYAPPADLFISAGNSRQSFLTGDGYFNACPCGFSEVMAWLPDTWTSVTAVPEPPVWSLMALGGLGVVSAVRRRKA